MLWFDNQAEEAVNIYTMLFENSKILNISKQPGGGVFTIEFELMGAKYTALNGGGMFKINRAFSDFIFF